MLPIPVGGTARSARRHRSGLGSSFPPGRGDGKKSVTTPQELLAATARRHSPRTQDPTRTAGGPELRSSECSSADPGRFRTGRSAPARKGKGKGKGGAAPSSDSLAGFVITCRAMKALLGVVLVFGCATAGQPRKGPSVAIVQADPPAGSTINADTRVQLVVEQSWPEYERWGDVVMTAVRPGKGSLAVRAELVRSPDGRFI